MDMGHLYHDAYFSSMAIELAVKERLKTREVNAREERHFEHVSQSFDKAKAICERNRTFERWRVGQSLRTISERTPDLDRSLAIERARVERAIMEGRGQRPVEDLHSIHRSKGQRKKRARQLEKLEEDVKPLNTDLQRNLHKATDFTKRSEHAVKALARLSFRQEMRRLEHERFKQDLLAFSKPLIERARVVLKGRDDLDVDQFLEEFQNYVHGDPHGSVAVSRTAPGSDVSLDSVTAVSAVMTPAETVLATSEDTPSDASLVQPQVLNKDTPDQDSNLEFKITSDMNESCDFSTETNFNHSKRNEIINRSRMAVNEKVVQLPVIESSNTQVKQNGVVGLTNGQADTTSLKTTTHRKNSRVNSVPYSPPASLSKVILEEDDSPLPRETSYAEKTDCGEHPNPDDQRMTAAVGLPQLWKQANRRKSTAYRMLRLRRKRRN
ncbi:uncharacterized protein LOC131945250 [Physella acuta]|uniref:uncharacterized protein LOC131945250 n=1 Tax=Physella acuta TaxID=109671 RepID=UPI0027DBDF14|nr:uncharacterized protein LOC131945250 [Physella acuta]XP_059162285.1 uncharacterized protein LOC131945250 [Physella acuta]